ncbi:MAG: beta-N-acetylhexosaminidase [Chitinophagaceae bacterium]
MFKMILTLLFLYLAGIVAAQPFNIIPQPVSVKRTTGNFKLSKATLIVVQDEPDKKTASYLNQYLNAVYGFTLGVKPQAAKNYIRLVTRKFIQAPEKDGYSLEVGANGITIEGDTYAGTFYGIQTLIQLFEPYDLKSLIGKTNGISVSSLLVPNVIIRDYPRFNYRGMHLDVGRHFFDVAFIKNYLDYIALHKMNYFHWHLTEDQGWRIQIKKYPKLTQTGAYRYGTIKGKYPGTGNDNKQHGGFYTQDQVKDIVQYAADRHITVIPEIEMPGHSSAAIAAYPWLSCFPQEKTKLAKHPSTESQQQQAAGRVKLVQESWGVFDEVFCAGNDTTFAFLEGVLREVLTLFPSPYIHIGGDEVRTTHWKKCPRCQERIKKEGLKNEQELQGYFIKRIERFLLANGRTLIGWDEILEGDLDSHTVVMSWQGEKRGISAAAQKQAVIMTPQQYLYFDHAEAKKEDSLTFGGYNPLEKVYAFEPLPRDLPATDAKYVLGAQANVWTEYMPTPSKVEYMIFPRMSALSEVLWSTKEGRNWSSFEKKLSVQKKRYELWNANWNKSPAEKIIASPESVPKLRPARLSKNSRR